MKKLLFFALLTLSGATLLQAQNISSIYPFQRLLPKPISLGLSGGKSPLPKAQLRAADSSRLIGISYYSYKSSKYAISDSEQFAYTGSNGGGLNQLYSTNGLKFTTENCWVFDAGDFADDTLITQKFDANDNVDTILVQVWNISTSKWMNYFLSKLTYNGNNNITLETDFAWDSNKNKWYLQDELQLSYVNNNPVTELGSFYDTTSSTFTPEIKVISSYTSFNVADTVIYQESNGSSLVNFERNIYFFDASDNDTAELVQSNTGTAWINYERAAIGYNAGTIYPKVEYILEWNSPGWDSAYKQLYYYDANYNDTLIVAQAFNQGEWDGDEEFAYQYNTFNQPTSFIIRTYASSSYTPIAKQLYYYQTYLAGINRLAVNNSQLIVYPNPTNGLITIASTKNIDEVRITNLLGQLVYQSQPVQTHFNFELSGAGIYFAEVKQGDKTTTQKIIVTK